MYRRKTKTSKNPEPGFFSFYGGGKSKSVKFAGDSPTPTNDVNPMPNLPGLQHFMVPENYNTPKKDKTHSSLYYNNIHNTHKSKNVSSMTPGLQTIPVLGQTSLGQNKKQIEALQQASYSANYNFLMKSLVLINKNIKYLDYLLKVIKFQSGILPQLTSLYTSLIKVKLYFQLLKSIELSFGSMAGKNEVHGVSGILEKMLNIEQVEFDTNEVSAREELPDFTNMFTKLNQQSESKMNFEMGISSKLSKSYSKLMKNDRGKHNTLDPSTIQFTEEDQDDRYTFDMPSNRDSYPTSTPAYTWMNSPVASGFTTERSSPEFIIEKKPAVPKKKEVKLSQAQKDNIDLLELRRKYKGLGTKFLNKFKPNRVYWRYVKYWWRWYKRDVLEQGIREIWEELEGPNEDKIEQKKKAGEIVSHRKLKSSKEIENLTIKFRLLVSKY